MTKTKNRVLHWCSKYPDQHPFVSVITHGGGEEDMRALVEFASAAKLRDNDDPDLCVSKWTRTKDYTLTDVYGAGETWHRYCGHHTPMSLAIEADNLSVLRYLLSIGMPLHGTPDDDPIFLSIAGKHAGILRYLLQLGADTNRNISGREGDPKTAELSTIVLIYDATWLRAVSLRLTTNITCLNYGTLCFLLLASTVVKGLRRYLFFSVYHGALD